jgi:AcrR family transcriptional regulator
MAEAPPRQRLSKAERRRVIEDAASELFAERGYAGTKLAEIAAAAGVTKQLLYQHFASKQELHLALLARHRDELLAGLEAGMTQPGPLAERIPATVDGWFRYVEEHPYALALLFRDTTGDPEAQAFYRELQASARAANVALLRAEPQLGVPAEQVEPLAELIRSASVGVALWWADHPEVPRATVVEVVVGALMNGLPLPP